MSKPTWQKATNCYRADGTRTSIRLEPAFKDALQALCFMEGTTPDALIARLSATVPRGGTLAGTVRTHILNYYRERART